MIELEVSRYSQFYGWLVINVGCDMSDVDDAPSHGTVLDDQAASEYRQGAQIELTDREVLRVMDAYLQEQAERAVELDDLRREAMNERDL